MAFHIGLNKRNRLHFYSRFVFWAYLIAFKEFVAIGSLSHFRPLSCFALRTDLFEVQGFVSNQKPGFSGGIYRVGSWESFVVQQISRPFESLPPVFLFCTADFSSWCIRTCVEWKVLLLGLLSYGAGVSQLVLHREPFFCLASGLRFLCRLKNCGHDACLTIYPQLVWDVMIEHNLMNTPDLNACVESFDCNDFDSSGPQGSPMTLSSFWTSTIRLPFEIHTKTRSRDYPFWGSRGSHV